MQYNVATRGLFRDLRRHLERAWAQHAGTDPFAGDVLPSSADDDAAIDAVLAQRLTVRNAVNDSSFAGWTWRVALSMISAKTEIITWAQANLLVAGAAH